jgi:hypothetical protein
MTESGRKIIYRKGQLEILICLTFPHRDKYMKAIYNFIDSVVRNTYTVHQQWDHLTSS